MPNWVTSRVVVKGPKAAVREFKKDHFNKGSGELGFDFNTVIDLHSHTTMEEVIAAWGTKWNASDTQILESPPGSLDFTFMTPWSSPYPIYDRLSELWPSLDFHVEAIEEGFEFAMIGDWHNGKGIHGEMFVTPEIIQFVYRRTPTERDLQSIKKVAKYHEKQAQEWAESQGMSTAGVLALWGVGIAGIGFVAYKARNRATPLFP